MTQHSTGRQPCWLVQQPYPKPERDSLHDGRRAIVKIDEEDVDLFVVPFSNKCLGGEVINIPLLCEKGEREDGKPIFFILQKPVVFLKRTTEL